MAIKTASGMLALAAAANAAYQGFNYGATFSDGSVKSESDFEAEFTAAAGLDGTDGAFTSARLYTMIQGDTTSDPISAIQAAINTQTSLLLGVWASAGADIFANEIEALKSAIELYGDDLASLVAGISVGSEDLYRITETAAANGELNPGVQPDVLADYITQVREAIVGTVLADCSIGHVDTWTVWANSSNQAVIDAVDWVGMDAYPYFESDNENPIKNAAALFAEAVANTNAGTGGKELWVTETGWPVSGEDIGDAVPSTENAKIFWDEVGCPMFGVTNVWWYTFQDSNPTTPVPSFSVIGSDVSTTPLYDLSCSSSTNGTGSSLTSPTSASSTGTGSTSSNGGLGFNGTLSSGSSSPSAGFGSGSSFGSGSGFGNVTSGSGNVTSGSGSVTSGSGSGSNDTVSSSSPDSTADSTDSDASTEDDTDTTEISNAVAIGSSFGAGALALMAALAL